MTQPGGNVVKALPGGPGDVPTVRDLFGEGAGEPYDATWLDHGTGIYESHRYDHDGL